MKTITILPAVCVLLAASLFVGCGTPAAGPAPSGQTSNVEQDHPAPSQFAEQLAKLDAADRTAAAKQANCPVSNEPLGSMGVPRKVVVNGREVFICCKGCEKEFLENADAYLAKLPKE